MSTGDQDPGAGERDRRGDTAGSGTQGSTARRSVRRRKVFRVEVGVFIRKLVNRRVVSEWQVPGGYRVHAAQASGSGPRVLQQASPTAAPMAHDAESPQEGELETVALSSTATDDSEDDGSTSEETSYEAGFFFRTESSSPPEYPTEPVKG